MLVEFRVRNFCSLRDEQVLSLVASADKSLQETNTRETGLKAVPRLLRSAVIYGANASGKSNLIKALRYMRDVVLDSATKVKPGQRFTVKPFVLNAQTAQEPVEFEVSFLLDGVRYQYGFAMTAERIVSEHLLVYKAFKPQRWFVRHVDEFTGKDVYEFGTGLKGSKSLWEGATRTNALFLSTAVQLNSEDLRPVFEWFERGLVIAHEDGLLNPQASFRMLMDEAGRRKICSFLASADISISDIRLEKKRANRQPRMEDMDAAQPPLGREEAEELRLTFHHATPQGKAEFEWEEESSGTRRLLLLAGPVLNILQQGQTLIIDELDASLHTLLLREIVRLFHDPAGSPNGAQLIFTTHDTSLLDAPGLFRRDQVWFVEKDAEQASSLVALLEFSPRKNEALERGYLMGRYGGVPFLGEGHLSVDASGQVH